MQWSRLISDKRLGLENYHDSRKGPRSDFQRDYDRAGCSRRRSGACRTRPRYSLCRAAYLVHNRLTHSMEVACVGRSLAREVSDMLAVRYAGRSRGVDKLHDIGDIVAAACLAHDLGNPPFGHSGEKAISTFFSEGSGVSLRDSLSPEQWCDLINFEGNANAFRQLTHQFNGRRPGGFAMTYSTLASIVKYPFESSLAVKANKFGFFTSEKEAFAVWPESSACLHSQVPAARCAIVVIRWCT